MNLYNKINNILLKEFDLTYGELLCDIPKKLVFHGSFDLKNNRSNVYSYYQKQKDRLAQRSLKI